jgi:hypothetical protein
MNLANVMSVDVEDYFRAEAFSDVVNRSRWESYPSRVEQNIARFKLETCEIYGQLYCVAARAA